MFSSHASLTSTRGTVSKRLMKFRTVASSVLRNVKNIPGWSTRRKIIVIESDDWGSIRVPSLEVYHRFLQRGYRVSEFQYNKYDALESNDDLTALFDAIRPFRDKNGNHVCITGNTIVANPDFDQIRKSGFREYHFEHFTKTLSRYPKHDKVFSLYREGIAEGLFKPQFHGREHLNINRWMKALMQADNDVLYCFDAETTYSGKDDYNFMEALDIDDQTELPHLNSVLSEGLRVFRDTFGYSSASFIAPCYTWDSAIEHQLTKEGIKYLQGGIYQYIPRGGFGNYSKKYHRLGERNTHGLLYLTRNCFFEPSLVQKTDWVDYTLSSIESAFRWNKPAIISSHRINFVGYLHESNRQQNLKMLNDILTSALKKWPDIEFMTSDQLGDLISKTKHV
jgi:hypothetical protein